MTTHCWPDEAPRAAPAYGLSHYRTKNGEPKARDRTETEATRRAWRFGPDYKAYRCQTCNGWHIGRKAS
jgi:hypothetical protein